MSKLKEKSFLESIINNGKKLEGTLGYILCEARCCCGTSKIYVQVKIVRVKIENCSFSLVVSPVPTTPEMVVNLKEFPVDPKHFYKDIQAVDEHEKRVSVWAEYNRLVEPFRYDQSGTLTRCRRLFKEALESTEPQLLEEILEEIGAEAEIKNLSRSQMKEWYEKMMAVKVGINPEDDEEEYDD